ncbi:hypothetical protein LPJ61_004177 [Coemansia biformis]|uniref:mRNA stability protein n=1 Tax=Coemansia biformis TaxID=1286918 RepID=A0A9W7Y5B0_9FUNG|nr:hypothetical protein LPJ61_004177 [Coemansia biformis]
MNPARQQKIDISGLSKEQKDRFGKYGKLPENTPLKVHKIKERKYFDSGDYALSKAGKAEEAVGESHPHPDSIPHHIVPPVVSAAPQSLVSAPGLDKPAEAPKAGNPLLRPEQQKRPQRLAKQGIPVPINAQVGRSRLGSGPTSPLAQAARPIHPLVAAAAAAQETVGAQQPPADPDHAADEEHKGTRELTDALETVAVRESSGPKKIPGDKSPADAGRAARRTGRDSSSSSADHASYGSASDDDAESPRGSDSKAKPCGPA